MNIFDLEKMLKDFDKLTSALDVPTIQELVLYLSDLANVQRALVREAQAAGQGQIAAIPAQDVVALMDKSLSNAAVMVLAIAKMKKLLCVPTEFVAPKLSPVTLPPQQVFEPQQWGVQKKDKKEEAWSN